MKIIKKLNVTWYGVNILSHIKWIHLSTLKIDYKSKGDSNNARI